MFSHTVKPPWDSAIAPLGSKDPSGHHNLLENSAIAPPGIIANALRSTVDKWVGGGTPLFPCVTICQRGPQAALPVHQHFQSFYVKLLFQFLVIIFSLSRHASEIEMDLSDSHYVLKMLILFQ